MPIGTKAIFDGDAGGSFLVGGTDFTQLAFNFGFVSASQAKRSNPAGDRIREVESPEESAESAQEIAAISSMAADRPATAAPAEVSNDRVADTSTATVDLLVITADATEDDADEDTSRETWIDLVFADVEA